MKIKQEWQPLRKMCNYLLLPCPKVKPLISSFTSHVFSSCLYQFPHLPESKVLRSSQFWPSHVLPTQYNVCCTDNCPGYLHSSQYLCLTPILRYINVTSLVFTDKVLRDPCLLWVVFLAQLVSNPILTPQTLSILITFLNLFSISISMSVIFL